MIRKSVFWVSVILLSALLVSCSGGGSPIQPDNNGTQLRETRSTESGDVSNRILWGLWQVTIDPEMKTIDLTPLRSAMVGVNVTRFLHPPVSPINMITFKFDFDESQFDAGLFVLDVTLKHPFPGLDIYRGFDVRGIFMSNFDEALPGDADLTFAGEDASHMLNPDGFTRWWNSTEFTSKTMFGFTPGKLAPKIYPTAILNPYKYFCDDLGADSPLDEVTIEKRGTFSSYSSNSRRYEIQFKMDGDKPVYDFNYAVDASWEDLGPDAISWDVEDFPLSANCNEAWRIDIDTSASTLFYQDPTTNGGQLVTQVTVHDWQALADDSTVPDQVAGINLHSTLLPSSVIDFLSGASLVAED
ncbi:MAG: hypothetical protein ABIC40_03540, partial [bacterium]